MHLLPSLVCRSAIGSSYVWEEPLLPPRLLVRVGPDILRGSEVQCGDRDSPPSMAVAHLQAWGVGRVYSEEAGTRSGQIKLIRSEESLSWIRYGFLERMEGITGDC